MLAYAAPRRGREATRPSVLMIIVAGHVLAIGAVMLAKGDFPIPFDDGPVIVRSIPIKQDPPPKPLPQPVPDDPAPSRATIADPLVPIRPVRPTDDALSTPPSNSADGSGTIVVPIPPALPPIPPAIVRRDARLTTNEAMLRPPYPDAKRMLGEEAMHRLRLSIDEQGRVTWVEPVGAADRAFLDSARRHLIRSWRFAPATENGRAVTSTKVITLRFELGEG